MCTRGQCNKFMGQWVNFTTPWGTHRGVITDVNERAVLIRGPRRYAPVGMVSGTMPKGATDSEKLDIALTQYGYGGYGGGYGGGWGYPGYYGWNGGWWWWWLAFAAIFALALWW